MKGRMTILGSCLLALLLLLSCAPGGGPEAAAKAAFEQWAQQNGVPYKDVHLQTLDDAVSATVRITAMFKESPETPWLEHEAAVECRKVGREWQAEAYMYFQLTNAERERQQRRANATATAITARAAATATAEAAATMTAEAQPASLKDTGRIAFQSSRDGNWEVYVMNADGAGQANLSNNPADDKAPTWSP